MQKNSITTNIIRFIGVLTGIAIIFAFFISYQTKYPISISSLAFALVFLIYGFFNKTPRQLITFLHNFYHKQTYKKVISQLLASYPSPATEQLITKLISHYFIYLAPNTKLADEIYQGIVSKGTKYTVEYLQLIIEKIDDPTMAKQIQTWLLALKEDKTFLNRNNLIQIKIPLYIYKEIDNSASNWHFSKIYLAIGIFFITSIFIVLFLAPSLDKIHIIPLVFLISILAIIFLSAYKNEK